MDKGWTDRDPTRWPVPYWDVDTGMAAMLLLLTAVEDGLGACFFGVPPDRHTAVRGALGIPENRRFVGVVSLGYAVPHPRSPSPVSYTHLDVYKRQDRAAPHSRRPGDAWRAIRS